MRRKPRIEPAFVEAEERRQDDREAERDPVAGRPVAGVEAFELIPLMETQGIRPAVCSMSASTTNCVCLSKPVDQTVEEHADMCPSRIRIPSMWR
jgi:hypothetical protein